MRSTTIPALIASLAGAALAAGATLTGTVRDAVTGAPVARAQVERLDNHLVVGAGADGAFAIEVPDAGGVALAVSSSGYRVTRLRVALPAAKPLAVALEPIVSHADRIEVTATRAREGTDPVSFTNLPQERVAETYWGQDPAIVLSETVPGYFAYNDSGNGI
ncbi:MAG TPA: carboxypeptidase regulatory-like domain-containing protein, partial [Thermoanaerobaculaceae bacterium]|nr:carboxypeptidase regulatory-like domain-containing protein [Thermoanaerobaculaceae bacterium]